MTKLIGLIGLIVLMGLVGFTAFAQNPPRLDLRVKATSVAPGSDVEITILVSTEKPLNAADLAISFPPAKLEFLYAATGDSIIQYWKTNPKATGEGIVEFGGGTVSPFAGEDGELAKLYFRAEKEGDALLSFERSNLYYADGRGTLAETEANSLNINITPEALLVQSLPEDNFPPRLIRTEISENPFDDFNLAFFDIKDDESGLNKIEARSLKWFRWGEWSEIPNPVGVEKNVWAINVRASDNEGNSTEKVIYIWAVLLRKIAYFVLAPILGLFLLYFGFKLLRKKSRPAPSADRRAAGRELL
ncbi:MAG: hypothetical protein UY26_C0003G0322 [Candidatus Jorgensenbacteria bacterium GW2011_GWA1_48_13]|uniref:Cohesin domain-containing protein n=1 Tax=Candidatus Jorgensenbacteria bacterium GW2011_GWB1_50_10 TaxID=1618665 RepID=A0A0G1W860_9BACT|nr:MAG: hypothetical protein UY26_C0003G0322 [Candidatus Jorgensenbacteria bacterium GW2011_GWA1_48_13]KKW14790.1 MAG: hypothetical protein UY55_C0003G0006 [Candidatus Jorgensenbacteria bacterium GW2011_GWB1_50_10]